MKLGPHELNKVHQADVMDGLGRLPESSVHCVVTSPPYWGLRNYSQDGQWGLEATPEEHTARMVAFGRECRRVLRRDGTLWLNYGDCFASGGRGSSDAHRQKMGVHTARAQALGRKVAPPGMKPKDLCGMPWRVAFALQGFAVISGGRLDNAADLLAEARMEPDPEVAKWRIAIVEGMLRAWADLSLWVEPFWNRCDVVWFKSNPMPESVRDRPTKAHEYVFLLTKSGKYFYDSEAVKEACNSGPSDVRKMLEGRERIGGKHKGLIDPLSKASSATNIGRKRGVGHPSGRNLRSVWAMATQPYPGAHYATFPQRLPEICIRAGTSEKGVCPECGAPWVRVVEKSYVKSPVHGAGSVVGRHYATGQNNYDGASMPRLNRVDRTVGWRATCGCGREDTVPAVVLDPFAGSGTTGIAAVKLGRDFIGFDLAGGDCDLGGHTPNQRIAAARAGLGLAESLAGQRPLW